MIATNEALGPLPLARHFQLLAASVNRRADTPVTGCSYLQEQPCLFQRIEGDVWSKDAHCVVLDSG